jgi:transglycosylase-like protein with SLT domain
VTARSLALGATLFGILSGPLVVGAQTFRLVEPDGTVHYTNAPTDPSYERMGLAPRRAPVVPATPAVDRGSTVMQLVKDAAVRYGVPEKLVVAVIRTESGFNPSAVSSKGARGLMQLMPQTASLLGVRNSFDPAENIDGGVRHLRRLIERYGSDLRLALAAYNAGEQAVAQHGGVPPYPETQGYVQKVLTMFQGTAEASPAAPAAARDAAPQATYRIERDDGTVVYTNVPPPSAARRSR